VQSPLDGFPEFGFVQGGYAFPLGGNHLGLVNCDIGHPKAHDGASIAFDKARGLSCIFVRARGYRVPTVKHFAKLVAVWNRREEFCHCCVVVQARRRRVNYRIHCCSEIETLARLTSLSEDERSGRSTAVSAGANGSGNPWRRELSPGLGREALRSLEFGEFVIFWFIAFAMNYPRGIGQIRRRSSEQSTESLF
jgi:hypothetical protein